MSYCKLAKCIPRHGFVSQIFWRISLWIFLAGEVILMEKYKMYQMQFSGLP